MRSSVQSAGVSWAGGVRVSSEKRQKGREGRPAGGAAGLLRDGRATARLRQLTDQCAPSKGQGAERHDPPPQAFSRRATEPQGGHRPERLEKSVRNSSGRCSVQGLHL